MKIINLEYRCPVCNSLFRVTYEKPESQKFAEKVFKISATFLTALHGDGGFIGNYSANRIVEGKDLLVKKITGSSMYKFRCPKCGYELEITI